MTRSQALSWLRITWDADLLGDLLTRQATRRRAFGGAIAAPLAGGVDLALFAALIAVPPRRRR